MRFHMLVSDSGNKANAIDQATSHLGDALQRAGHDVQVAPWVRGHLTRDTEGSDFVVVPYNPFMWARWGFAPGLVLDVAKLEKAQAARIALVIHEPYVPVADVKSLLMGAWQRVQLGALILMVDRRFASIEPWAAKFSRIRQTHHLPSGSNLPDARDRRAATRSALGAEDGLVVATLSSGHPAHLSSYVEAGLSELARKGMDVTFLQLGAGARPMDTPAEVRVIRPGMLPTEQLAALVASADLFLAPFVDGVSTRRTSFTAGLCEGVAVVGTSGPLTDPMLLRAQLELVEVGSPAHFAKRVAALASDSERREAAAATGHALFEAEFTWDAIAKRFLVALGGS